MKSRLALLLALVAAMSLGLVVVRPGPLSPVFFQPIPVASNGGVVEVDLLPVPEGPSVSFKRVATTVGGTVPLGPADQFIPDPLPPPLFQWLCNRGGNMVVILGSGKQVTYGPCFRPGSINRLWAQLAPSGPPR